MELHNGEHCADRCVASAQQPPRTPDTTSHNIDMRARQSGTIEASLRQPFMYLRSRQSGTSEASSGPMIHQSGTSEASSDPNPHRSGTIEASSNDRRCGSGTSQASTKTVDRRTHDQSQPVQTTNTCLDDQRAQLPSALIVDVCLDEHQNGCDDAGITKTDTCGTCTPMRAHKERTPLTCHVNGDHRDDHLRGTAERDVIAFKRQIASWRDLLAQNWSADGFTGSSAQPLSINHQADRLSRTDPDSRLGCDAVALPHTAENEYVMLLADFCDDGIFVSHSPAQPRPWTLAQHSAPTLHYDNHSSDDQSIPDLVSVSTSDTESETSDDDDDTLPETHSRQPNGERD